jgi:hypothetical protein
MSKKVDTEHLDDGGSRAERTEKLMAEQTTNIGSTCSPKSTQLSSVVCVI